MEVFDDDIVDSFEGDLTREVLGDTKKDSCQILNQWLESKIPCRKEEKRKLKNKNKSIRRERVLKEGKDKCG
jgi:hypothetical protein